MPKGAELNEKEPRVLCDVCLLGLGVRHVAMILIGGSSIKDGLYECKCDSCRRRYASVTGYYSSPSSGPGRVENVRATPQCASDDYGPMYVASATDDEVTYKCPWCGSEQIGSLLALDQKPAVPKGE